MQAAILEWFRWFKDREILLIIELLFYICFVLIVIRYFDNKFKKTKGVL